jgi:ABC-type branched-subunit amino acid transport system permease subunit
MSGRTTLTPIAGLAVLGVIAGIVMLIVGSSVVQFAGVVIVILGLVALALGMFMASKPEDLTRGPHGIDPPSSETPEQEAAEREAAWEHEQELYREKDRGEQQT